MGGLASGAFYLASPLAVMGHPAATKSDVPPLPVIASAAENGPEGKPANPVIIATVPPVGGLGGFGGLSDVITREVRRLIKERPDSGSGSASLPGFGDVEQADTVDDDVAPEPGNLKNAVIAAHGVRIAYLKQRMEALRSGGADLHRLDDLRDRLHRAEAARRLAVSRASSDAPPSDDCETEACRPSVDASASSGSAVHRSAALLNPWEEMEIPRIAAAPRRSVARPVAVSKREGGRIATASRRNTHDAARAVAGLAARSSAHEESLRTHMASARPVSQHRVADASSHRVADASGHRMAQARRSLALARSVLEGHADRVAHPHAAPAPVIAGLWRWAGSDTWSLADYRAGTT